MSDTIEQAYARARDVYASLGADTERALAALARVPLSLPCWQGDDVRGFERRDASLSGGGIQATGSCPGRARNAAELRADLEKALTLIPGRHRVNLHAMYLEPGPAPVDRDAVEPRHFEGWTAWAREQGVGLDFNATLFSHPMAASGFTLASPDPAVRDFWIEHVRRCRDIAARMGSALGTPCIHNLWIPDGAKDLSVDRARHRELLLQSLDAIYKTSFDRASMKDAVESKLFGIGSESFVAGSHEFYLGYALSRGLLLCLDLGHFHPTESVADKISSLLLFFEEMLLHLSRGVRWDSDHVVILDDALRDTAAEIVRANALGRVHLALDFFDASINRAGAWVTGARAVLKALLSALLEPVEKIREHERAGNHFAKLALLEECKTLPLGAVWDAYCLRQGVPSGREWLDEVLRYERDVLRARG